eukprot:886134-Amphidinium_carterae.1
MKYGFDPFGQTKLYPSVMHRRPTDSTSGVARRAIKNYRCDARSEPLHIFSCLDRFDASVKPFAVLRISGF